MLRFPASLPLNSFPYQRPRALCESPSVLSVFRRLVRPSCRAIALATAEALAKAEASAKADRVKGFPGGVHPRPLFGLLCAPARDHSSVSFHQVTNKRLFPRRDAGTQRQRLISPGGETAGPKQSRGIGIVSAYLVVCVGLRLSAADYSLRSLRLGVSARDHSSVSSVFRQTRTVSAGRDRGRAVRCFGRRGRRPSPFCEMNPAPTKNYHSA